MVRISDVAKMANVSTATVSRVLSNSGNVKKETAEKVLEAIKKLNYQPNLLARQLRRLETKTVLVVVPDITNTFFSKILRGIEQVAIENDYEVLLGDTGNSLEREKGYLDILRQKKADGMILLTARLESHLLEEISHEFPVVLACEYLEGSDIPTVSIDNISSARKATEYLISLGHKRIGFLSGPMDVILSRDRLKGFKQGMMQHDIAIEPNLIQEGDFSFESGFNLMTKLLALTEPPTAVFASSDEMAIGAIKAIKAKGLKVPDDISIVGFDDIKFASIFEPALTTVSQPMFEIGQKAMELLIKLIQKDKLEKSQYILEDQLVIRETCKEKKKDMIKM
ncbi:MULTISPECIES: LacI family DNA-binding transcriptional regulator [Aeribacillus]|jgi:Transcriptional regulators|uniref:LacI family DNA-binding transcriptional regulator n=1 Tax=Aeribacillus composti TaxID=1868734 RepID=A0ABY9WAA4_9BACI|nr:MULTISPECIES: LacI family DNA-binding transcriptional regulator [Aeribacillus]REJ22726.1 MAG: LacI family transcriptional regulator [Bacillaceae bacterium]KZM53384.1 LacI family transcriptional regulator [Aeribacillus pallidus]MDR9796881.1 LacI family DNA-binding transcriptional regulator [Aeribacillus pallidus]MED0649311.1 LacI family DNA-binding transcriptional regulator [Aeribacillus composti]MED0702660.1 LacI family DNA-binding transcriptional regulator [Aeribacillus composti]